MSSITYGKGGGGENLLNAREYRDMPMEDNLNFPKSKDSISFFYLSLRLKEMSKRAKQII